MNEYIQEYKEEGYSIADYIAILKRRFWYLVIPALVIFVIAAAVAMLIPAVYRSEAKILIEQQQIPQDLVRSTVTSYADQRVQNISQRVMTTENLGKIIEKYDMYPEQRKETALSEIVAQMREEVKLQMVSADVVDSRSGSTKKATIAFTLAFESQSASMAQKVTSELVSMFLDENLRKRREAARETSSFLEEESNRLAAEISEIEARLARFKEEKGDALPEMQAVNSQIMRRTEDRIERNQLEARLLEERIHYLEAELARTSRYAESSDSDNNNVITPRERLVQLNLQYLELSTRVKSDYPDLVLLKREMNALKAEIGDLTKADIEQLITEARKKLTEKQRAYADGHPDVKAARRTLGNLEDLLESARDLPAESIASQLPENSRYLDIKTRLEMARSELASLQQQKNGLTSQLAEYEKHVIEGPKIEREYRAISRDYDNALAKYREIRAKQMEAELGESLESGRKAERFVLIEPPVVPIKPFKPNRLQIFFLGIVFSFGGGLGSVFAKEVMSDAVYDSKAVKMATGAPPIAVISYLETAEEVITKRRRKIVLFGILILLLIGSAWAVHRYIKPLDLAAYHLMQKAGWVQPQTETEN